MTAMEWHCYLELNGMGAIHEAAERMLKNKPIPPPPVAVKKVNGNRGRYRVPSPEVVAARREKKRADDRVRQARIKAMKKLSSADRVANMMAAVKGAV